MDRPYTHPFLLTLLCNYLLVLEIPSIDLVHSKLVRINSYLITCDFHPPFPLCKYQWSSTVEHQYRVWCCATVASKCVMSVAGFFVNFFLSLIRLCVLRDGFSIEGSAATIFSQAIPRIWNFSKLGFISLTQWVAPVIEIWWGRDQA